MPPFERQNITVLAVGTSGLRDSSRHVATSARSRQFHWTFAFRMYGRWIAFERLCGDIICPCSRVIPASSVGQSASGGCLQSCVLTRFRLSPITLSDAANGLRVDFTRACSPTSARWRSAHPPPTGFPRCVAAGRAAAGRTRSLSVCPVGRGRQRADRDLHGALQELVAHHRNGSNSGSTASGFARTNIA